MFNIQSQKNQGFYFHNVYAISSAKSTNIILQPLMFGGTIIRLPYIYTNLPLSTMFGAKLMNFHQLKSKFEQKYTKYTEKITASTCNKVLAVVV